MAASKKTTVKETVTEVEPLDFSALDNVADIVIRETVEVPDKVKSFVEDAYMAWLDSPDKYRTVTLPSEDAAKALLKLMRKYAKTRQPEPLTIRTRDVGEPQRLVFRAVDKQTRNASK